MKSTLNNQLAQVCNNLYCILRQVKKYCICLGFNFDDGTILCELEAEYNTLFKLIYGDK